MVEQQLFLLDTHLYRYLVPKSDIAALQTVDGWSPYIFDLGALLDPCDQMTRRRGAGLVTPLRRKQLVFVVERIDLLEHAPPQSPLPGLLAPQLTQPWASGAREIAGQLVIQLDLRAVARTVWQNRELRTEN